MSERRPSEMLGTHSTSFIARDCIGVRRLAAAFGLRRLAAARGSKLPQSQGGSKLPHSLLYGREHFEKQPRGQLRGEAAHVPRRGQFAQIAADHLFRSRELADEG